MAALEQLGRIDRQVTSLRVLIAPALPDDDEFRSTKDHSAKKWLARVSGTSQSAAHSLLSTAGALPDLPLVEAAMRSGSLSAPQLGLIAEAVESDPTAEADMVEAARTESLFGLRGKADQVKAAAAGKDEERHAKAKKRQRFGMSNSRDGLGITLDGFGPADEATILLQALRLFQQDIFKEACASGERPSQASMAWDALIAMARFALGETPAPKSGGRGPRSSSTSTTKPWCAGVSSPARRASSWASAPFRSAPSSTSSPKVMCSWRR